LRGRSRIAAGATPESRGCERSRAVRSVDDQGFYLDRISRSRRIIVGYRSSKSGAGLEDAEQLSSLDPDHHGQDFREFRIDFEQAVHRICRPTRIIRRQDLFQQLPVFCRRERGSRRHRFLRRCRPPRVAGADFEVVRLGPAPSGERSLAFVLERLRAAISE